MTCCCKFVAVVGIAWWLSAGVAWSFPPDAEPPSPTKPNASISPVEQQALAKLRARCSHVRAEPREVGPGQAAIVSLVVGLVDDEDAEQIGVLRRLQDLQLGGPITDKGLLSLRPLSELRTLWLDAPRATDEGFGFLQDLRHVEQIQILSLEVTDTTVRRLSRCTQLRHLDLSNCKVTGDCFRDLQGLTKLQRLRLGGTAFDGANLRFLAKCGDLEWLDLTGCKVNDEQAALLRGFPKLEFLNVDGTQVSAQMVAELRKALPELTVLGR